MEKISNSQTLDEKIARVADILEQVEELNKMIELHRSDSNNNSMLSQYQFMKSEFIKELEMLLGQFQIKIRAA